MADMLVKLLHLPEERELFARLSGEGVVLRHPLPPEKSILLNWIRENFYSNWADECDVAFAAQPVSAFVAVANGKILGFACYEATCRNFFGPTGVHPDCRGRGIGLALLLKGLYALREMGYVYCFIGDPGPAEFYRKAVGAIPVEGKANNLYDGMLTQ